jgi:chorismate mutase/prephenate dehydrogenase
MTPRLEDLRRRLNDIDRRLLAASPSARRQRRGRAGEARDRAPTRDYEREREVILGVRAAAQELGVSPALAEDLLRLLIRSSLTTQERASVAARWRRLGRRVLVIGGAGLMGRWFVEFLKLAGLCRGSGRSGRRCRSGRHCVWMTGAKTDLQHDFIVLATPLGVTDAILRDLALRRPPGCHL